MFINFAVIILSVSAFYDGVIRWLQDHMLSCPSKKYLHIDCPGCGFQRSLIELFKGNMGSSFSLYPATIPMLVLLGYTLLHLTCKFEKGGRTIIFLQATTAIVIVVFYIYKIITHKLTA